MRIRRLIAAIRSLGRWPRSLSPGEAAERLAERELRRKGYTIVARRARSRLGEIDIVAVDGRVVVFVEVKSRQGNVDGHPADAVDRDKQTRLTRAALVYLKRHGLLEYPARFDVVAVTIEGDDAPPKIEHVINAFDSIGRGQMFS